MSTCVCTTGYQQELKEQATCDTRMKQKLHRKNELENSYLYTHLVLADSKALSTFLLSHSRKGSVVSQSCFLRPRGRLLIQTKGWENEEGI